MPTTDGGHRGGPRLHITVAALDMGGKPNDLTHEVRLVKAALLYADTVTLASPKATMLAMIGSIAVADATVRSEVIKGIAAHLNPEAAQAFQYADALRGRPKGRRSRDDLLAQMKIDATVTRAQQQLLEVVERLMDDESVRELSVAIDAGLLDLHALGAERSTDPETLVTSAVDLLRDVVAPAADTYPLFDDWAGGMVRAMQREGMLDGARLSSATHAGLAGRYIDQIETFPDAPMALVLEARDKLAEPLVRFRSGISEIAKDLGATPLDEDFGPLANEMYLSRIAPELELLAALAAETRLLPALRQQVAGAQAGPVLKGVLALAATATAQLPDYAVAAATGLAVGADVLGRARSETREARKSMRENKFLWLHEAPGRLDGGAPNGPTR